MDSIIFYAISLIMIAAVVLNVWQMRKVARAAMNAKLLLAANTLVANDKLDEIHGLVNSRLSDALQTIEDLKALLLLALSSVISPDDPRIREVLQKKN